MSFEDKLFRIVATPREWMQDQIEQAHISTAKISRMINCTTPQLHHWLTGTEKIPTRYLSELALQLGQPNEVQRIQNLKLCEDYGDHLVKTIHKFAQYTDIEAFTLIKILVAKIEELTIQDVTVMPFLTVEVLLSEYILHATFVVKTALDLCDVDFIGPFITADNVVRHLQYPVNRFVGVLLDLPNLVPTSLISAQVQEFRQKLLANLRNLLAGGLQKKNYGNLIQMHSIHLLARHGERRDAKDIERLVVGDAQFSDHLTRRLGYIGLALSEGEEKAEIFIREINNDADLGIADIVFDAIHYGDINLNLQAIPRKVSTVRRAIFHNIKHICDPKETPIRHIDLHRLNRILVQYGENTFKDPYIMGGLLEVFERNSPLNTVPEFRKIVVEFQGRFIKLLKDHHTANTDGADPPKSSVIDH